MRVLHFYKTAMPDSTGGVEQLIDQLARSTSELGVKVDVLSLSARPMPTTIFNGYNIHQARLDFQVASTGFSYSALTAFARLAKEADVIHYHFPWPYMDLAHFLVQIKKPTVLTYHSDIIRQKHLLKLYKPLRWRFLNSLDRIVATSPNYMASSDVLAPLHQKVQTIPIGLDSNSYPPHDPERVQRWRERLGDRYFAFVGVLRYYKGLHVLLEAAKRSRYPVAIAGAGPLEHQLKCQARTLGLDHVHFLGFIDEADKRALIEGCLGVIFPSHLRSEAFGISLLEGAMFGKPMISSEIGTGTSFINIHEHTGLVVPPADPQALHQAMQTLWADPERAQSMGQQAHERYLQLFTADRMAESYLQLYQNVLENHSA